MQPEEYERMRRAEQSLWWYGALHANLAGLLRRFVPCEGGLLLDAGCGTGGTLARLAGGPARQPVLGIDRHVPAVRATAARPGLRAAAGCIGALPLADGCLGSVICADVLCQAQVEPMQALREMFRCLRPGGTLLLQLPAYPWLRSYHDRHVHSVRRFTRSGAIRLLEQAGFRVRFASHWNAVLFPLMVIRRKLLPPRRAGSDVGSFPGWANRLFAALVAVETALIARGIALPFGGSLLIVATRPEDAAPAHWEFREGWLPGPDSNQRPGG